MRERKNNMTFLVTLLLIVLSLVLVACSSDGSKNSENGVTTVTFWIGGGAAGDALKEAIKTFNEEHDDIQVEGTYAKSSSTSDDKLLTATAGGNPPDIAFFDRFKVSSWVEQDSLTDITEYAEKDDISKDDFYSFAWDEAHYNDKLYAIPLSTDSRLLYYNKDQFKEVGLDPNEPPKTIDELEEVSMKLTKPKGNRFERIGFIPWYNQGQLFTWGLSFGGTFFDEETGKVTPNSPEIVEALDWLSDYASEYGVSQMTGFADSAGSDAQDPFLTGQLSMKVDHPGGVTMIEKYKSDLNYDVAPVPTPSGENFTTWSGGMSLVIPKGAKHADEAWEFLKFMANEEGQKIYSEISGDLAAVESANIDLYEDHDKKQKFIELLPEAHHRPLISESSLYWNELEDALEKAIHDKGASEEILENVAEKVNQEIE